MAFSLLDTPAELRREPAFLLYTADFSRIQRFIYTVHTEGALRSLRSRSFFLELLMEHYMDELLDGCGLTRTNIIYSGGGHCYLLLPNTAAVQQTLADWNRAFNGWLNEQFGVQLFLANGWTPCSANDLCNVPAEASPYKATCSRRVERVVAGSLLGVQHRFTNLSGTKEMEEDLSTYLVHRPCRCSSWTTLVRHGAPLQMAASWAATRSRTACSFCCADAVRRLPARTPAVVPHAQPASINLCVGRLCRQLPASRIPAD